MGKPWQYQREQLHNKQPYKRAFEINAINAAKCGGCWSETDYCDDTHCPCADTALDQAKSEQEICAVNGESND